MSTVTGRDPRLLAGTRGVTRDRTVLSPVAATVVVTLVWLLLELSVQPWSRSDSLGGTDSSSLLKGVVLLACLLALVVFTPPRTRLAVPPVFRIYLLFTMAVILSSLLLPSSLTIMVRAGRFMAGIAVLVLLFPLIKDRAHTFVRIMFGVHLVLGLSVLAGMVLLPSQAWLDGRNFAQGGRLMGAIMPMMPPRVGEIGAVVLGLGILLWALRLLPLPVALGAVALGAALIVLSRTRTAPLAALTGLLLAALALRRHQGARRIAAVFLTACVAAAPFLGTISTWALRGQDTSQLERLSGRTLVWDFILSQPMTDLTRWFGHGLGEKRILLRRGEGDINYMAIDNSWLDSYWEAGLVGLVLIVAAALAALLYALRTPEPGARAVAAFLCGYVLVASINESGLCDLSSMTLLLLASAQLSLCGRFHTEGLPAGDVSRGPRLSILSGRK
ncbi:O-antigen ligase family protein [Arthrobacter sp. Y-9]|uniref:O-antigen ligase family protein n=1 Tax=Arthrobacter sp. Y-9 TaxID=3039385 RepID=UPI00241CBD28|nr:O-antigen ligase family protein [Arthrobacter sp. Y-9]WFR84918.1 O-antigen ligase family protein [Arthrobacter sp. Y-9]